MKLRQINTRRWEADVKRCCVSSKATVESDSALNHDVLRMMYPLVRSCKQMKNAKSNIGIRDTDIKFEASYR